MTDGDERAGVPRQDRDDPGRRRAARALGLEVRRERYLRTLDRVRRCGRAARVAALFGPLARVTPGDPRRSVEVASADARVVLAKLWTAGERYRRVLDAVGGDGDRIAPGGGVEPTTFADLRDRLSRAPGRYDAGQYGAVAEAMAAADRTVRTLLEAREDDCDLLAGFDPEALASAAEEAAAEMRADHEARREAVRERRSRHEPGVEADYLTPVGNSDAVRPEALEAENVDPDLIAALADEDDEVDGDEVARALGADDAATDLDPARDAADAAEVIGERFDIETDEEGVTVVEGEETREREDGAGEETPEKGGAGQNTPEDVDADDGDGRDDEDPHGGFEFGAVADDEESSGSER
jgi:hypothetical protein